jgi:hypothetical protein
MASESDLKKLQDQQGRQRQRDRRNKERKEKDLPHKPAEQIQEFKKMSAEQIQKKFEEMQQEMLKKLAEKDKMIEQLQSQSRKIASTPPHHSSLTFYSKAFDGQSCTPRAAELTSSSLSQ